MSGCRSLECKKRVQGIGCRVEGFRAISFALNSLSSVVLGLRSYGVGKKAKSGAQSA